MGQYLRDKYSIEVDIIKDYPKDRNENRITFRNVIERWGYPIISKMIANHVYTAKRNSNSARAKILRGEIPTAIFGFGNGKWSYLVDAPFKISGYCCNVMKKNPSHKFIKSSRLKPIIGTMASESVTRRNIWLKEGCNSFDVKDPSSKPISFWTTQDILEYIDTYKLPLASIYGTIKKDEKGRYYTTECSRTGCIFCGFGIHCEKEPNRFQRLKITHPTIYDYCMKPWDKGGLGLDEVLNYINIPH